MPPNPHATSPATVTAIDRAARTVVAAFNTWAYKREQPSDLDLLHRTVATRVAADLPISFVLYWGKGRRRHIAAPDLQCLDFITGFAARIGDVYAPGARLTLLLTDTHATLNDHHPSAIDCYFAEIAAAATKRRLETRRLSDVVATLPRSDYPSDVEGVPEGMRAQLVVCAEKWYGGPGDAETGAARYLAMNMVEKAAVEREYPQSVFVTFNGRDYRMLFPDHLPIVYMYSIKKGTAVKPWFLPAPVEQSAAARAISSPSDDVRY